MLQTRVNENPFSVWFAFMMMTLTDECSCVAGLISSCKHVFVILNYIENVVPLGHSKTFTSKNGKYVFIEKLKKFIYQLRQEMFHLQNHILNTNRIKFQFAYQEKKSGFDSRSPHDFDVSFWQKDWEELAKATEGTASVLQFIPITFSSISVTTSMTSCPPTVWDFPPNLNLQCKEKFL